MRLALVVTMLAILAPLGDARADGGTFNARLEPAAAFFVDEPQRTDFGIGRDVTLRAEWSPIPVIGLEVAIGQMQFTADRSEDPGRAWTIMAGGRVRPFDDGSWSARARRGGGRAEIGLGGLWAGLQGGFVETQGLSRFGFALGGGLDVPVVQAVSVGPFVRYEQVLQSDSEPGPDDAQMVLAGLSLMVGFAHPDPIVETPEPPPPAPVDTDGDGITDDLDRCPREPEDRDQFQDEDGCPDPDNDGDGIADGADRCPNEAETMNGTDDTDGCPDVTPQAVVTAEQIVINDQINFEFNSAELLASSSPILDRVAEIILQHPQLGRIRIEGHTDDRGGIAWNMRLSNQRANSVMRYLVSKGVPAERLDAVGFGKTRPLDPSDTDEAHARNRRVEFHIIDASPSPATP